MRSHASEDLPPKPSKRFPCLMKSLTTPTDIYLMVNEHEGTIVHTADQSWLGVKVNAVNWRDFTPYYGTITLEQ